MFTFSHSINTIHCLLLVTVLTLFTVRPIISTFDLHVEEEFEDTKEVIRIRISKKNRQHNDQKKKDKRTNNDLQNGHIKQRIE